MRAAKQRPSENPMKVFRRPFFSLPFTSFGCAGFAGRRARRRALRC
ncbi:hypothetical protein HMPREF9120_00579 [Neisseria sp. oral taxon 020 str. F0370]|nr:hypothetical protein HMPREF9120_00579 [Neisseria sp. oral taxon 020 str. F0370]